MLAQDLMTKSPVTVNEQSSVKHAVELMVRHGISGLPVVNDEGVTSGMLTEGDILKRSELNRALVVPDNPDDDFYRSYVQAHATMVADCMSRDLASVPPSASLAQVVGLMRNKGVKRLPVIDNGTLVGIVSRKDVFKAITPSRENVASGGDALRLALSTRLRSELGIDLGTFDLRINGSLAEISGNPFSEYQRKAMRVVAESISGLSGIKIAN
ncbi:MULTISPECIES: CBS domain-containing protein [unclassified Rhizobium]|uniref:CBS domain-containing protein n=1 Tax=unclassified Rhizobium TaxID=2613769 RepID=UPI00135C0C7D|nr:MULTISPECIES: CBS domain-containing protein [unclassified Rhizobium]